MTFFEAVVCGQRIKWFDFGGDPESFADSGSSRILYYSVQNKHPLAVDKT